MQHAKLIDTIYEAAFIPELWQEVCVGLSDCVDGFSAALITLTEGSSFRWVCSPAAQEGMEFFAKSPLRFQNVRPQRHLALSTFSFTRDIDLMTEEELATDPIYNEFLRPQGLGWTVGDMVLEPSGHTIIFDLIRETDKGPFGEQDVALLNTLRPHLARAATMSSRLEFERINAAVQALELTGLPAAVIGASGKVLTANALMQKFEPQVVLTAFEKVVFGFAEANAKFREVLDSGEGMRPAGCSFPLPKTEHNAPAVVHLVPICGDARDIFAQARFFLIVTPVDRSRVPSAETIQGLFDLSPAEARVARSLSLGNDVARTAAEFSIATETVRSHIRSILGKSGMSRQADFVAAVSSIRPLGDDVM
ncbi:helix-turn-helix transcriptional regulator [Rhizobium sp. RU36D]|uniref:helix-turn-helix transcriptional regulator n=1 Tax=Rhizobium sp. RU36D TaxID=1907415 RepID=UPI0009D82D95|nr:helix-turn-helix transcriptional regulator [Rhizobium sp. RU36D]SMC96822.1 DNA-binding transcriptional regulator, CsgD family [Rhizobium sp. RU36D]